MNNGIGIIEDHLIEVCAGVSAHVCRFYDLCSHRDTLWCQAYLEFEIGDVYMNIDERCQSPYYGGRVGDVEEGGQGSAGCCLLS